MSFDIITAVIIVAVFVILPLYLRSDVILLLGALAFGWVLNSVTGNDLLLIARSSLPVERSLAESISLVMLSFIPALSVVLLTRSKTKNSLKLLLSVGFMPAIAIIAWLLARVSFSYDTASSLRDSSINDIVAANQEYALWSAGIILLLYLFADQNKRFKKSDKD